MSLDFNRDRFDEVPLPWHARPSADLQRLLPHHLLSNLAHRLANSRIAFLKRFLIQQVIKFYYVDMTQALESDPDHYACFNDFFTRALRQDARPVDSASDVLLSPVDGIVSQIGVIRKDRLLQAKGRDYSLLELLGGDETWYARFVGGYFATLSMSLGDSHRVFMPIDGELVRMQHVPGRLFDLTYSNTRLIPRLFVRNERVICLFETQAGSMAIILVGSMFVGSISTVWAGAVSPVSRRVGRWDYTGPQGPVRLVRGAELGRFNLGSAVIVLLSPGRIEWDTSLRSGSSLRMGMRLGRVKSLKAIR